MAVVALLAYQSRLAGARGYGAGPACFVGQAYGPPEQLGVVCQVDDLATAPGQRAEQGGGAFGAEAGEGLVGENGVVPAEAVTAHPFGDGCPGIDLLGPGPDQDVKVVAFLLEA